MDWKSTQDRLQKTLHYMMQRKETLYRQIEVSHDKLDKLKDEIEEQKHYLEIEEQRTKQESNLFSLYDSAQTHVQEKERLEELIDSMNREWEAIHHRLDELQEEFSRVCDCVVAQQVLCNEQQSEQEKAVKKQTNDADFAGMEDKIRLCIQLVDLDKERCKIELQKLLEEVIPSNCEK